MEQSHQRLRDCVTVLAFHKEWKHDDMKAVFVNPFQLKYLGVLAELYALPGFEFHFIFWSESASELMNG
jgi:hypothetical protein